MAEEAVTIFLPVILGQKFHLCSQRIYSIYVFFGNGNCINITKRASNRRKHCTEEPIWSKTSIRVISIRMSPLKYSSAHKIQLLDKVNLSLFEIQLLSVQFPISITSELANLFLIAMIL